MTEISPILRLFLSVDLVGSTALKNLYTPIKLLEKFDERKQILTTIAASTIDGLKIPEDLDYYSPPVAQKLLHDISKQDYDWSQIIIAHFSDFDSKFRSQYNDIAKPSVPADKKTLPIWKCMGDELIYSIPIKDITEIRNATLAFLETIRFFDQQACDRVEGAKKLLRLKGTGWTAGFPIRNKEIAIDGLLEQADYIGPDMDIGFRLSQHTYPGFLCASIDLVYLLGSHNKNYSELTAMIVGWTKLKGVWNNNSYPIIWLAPPGYRQDKKTYQDFFPWAPFENSYANMWNEKCKDKICADPTSELNKEIDQIWNLLPEQLGLIPPYIASNLQSENIPLLHKKIYGLLKILNDGDAGSQGIEDRLEDGENDAINEKIKEINSLISKK